MKTCTKCKAEKDENEFYKKGKYLNSECKACTKLRSRASQIKNAEHRKTYLKEYILKNKSRINEVRDTWIKNNPDKRKNIYTKHNRKPETRKRQTTWQRSNRSKYGNKYQEADRIRARKHSKEKSESLHPKYVKDLLKSAGYSTADIEKVPTLIPIKQIQVIEKRIKKQKLKNNDTRTI